MLVFATAGVPCWADEAVAEATVAFDIPQQRADVALTAFAEQADLTLMFPPELVENLSTNALIGRYTAAEGAEILLAGTGLIPTFSNHVVLSISTAEQSATEGKTMNTKKKAGLVAILAGVLAGGVNAEGTDDPIESPVDVGVVTGKVTDARTGANLKGARVTLEETGQSTSTNDLGEFRFANVPAGTATLTVSYLGYAGQSAAIGVRGPATAYHFALLGGSELEEIVVFGQRSARAQALNQERTAENATTVLSSDLLGQFEGATLAESLRRAPGIAFQEDPLTGEGTNVIVRGLAPDLNQIRLDGQRLAEGSGRGRSPAIGNLLTASIDEVTISKTLLPSQDSNGAGGLIEITTAGPLDRPRRFARFSAETEWNDGFEDAVQLSGTLSRTLGSDDSFGLSASLQYRETTDKTVGYSYLINGFGQYLPLAADGTVLTWLGGISPTTRFPFEEGVDEVYPYSMSSALNDTDTEILAGTLSAQWQLFEHTDWRLSYTRTEQETESTNRSTNLNISSLYRPLPIGELDGETRGAYVWEAVLGPDRNVLDTTVTGAAEAGFGDNITDVMSFQGTTNIQKWEFDYRLSRSTGSQESVSYEMRYGLLGGALDMSRAFVSPAALGNTIDGRLVSLFAPRQPGDRSYVLPLLNGAGFDFFNDTSNFGFTDSSRLDVNFVDGENERQSSAFSMRRSFSDSILTYLELGGELEATRFTFNTPNGLNYSATDDLSLAELGIDAFRGNLLADVGLDTGFFTVADEDFTGLIDRLETLSSGPDPILTSAVFSTAAFSSAEAFTDEQETALYLQGRLDIGNLEVIGGVRRTAVEVDARYLSGAGFIDADGNFDFEFLRDSLELVDESASEAAWLPRIVVNYRPQDNLVIRGGYYQTVSRPRIQDLSTRASVVLDLRRFFGPSGDRPVLRVRKGNADLRPSVTHSYDLSAALYDNNVGVLQASVFYKTIDDFVEFVSNATSDSLAGVTLPDNWRFQDLPDDIFVSVTSPTNNDEAADIWGFELNVERRFVNLPGAWSGLGMYANYTYTDSEKFFVFDNVFDPSTGEFIDVEVSGVPFDQSPQHSGTFAITYNKHGIDGSIAYTAQSERLNRFSGRGLSFYQDEDETLDARIEYQFSRIGGDWRIFAAGIDLLKSSEDPDTLSYQGDASRKYFTDATFFGGRTFSVGVSGTF